jgi:hypothetical protein
MLSHEPERVDKSKGYEGRDVRVSSVVVFLVALSVFAVVTAVLAYGVGKALDARPLGNMASNPELQNKMAEMTHSFSAPRLQTEDGKQDVTDLNAREDLLLENYSRADSPLGKVRIPIECAMELLAQRGLPVASPVKQAPLVTGDQKPVVAVPLTNGFARTGWGAERQ